MPKSDGRHRQLLTWDKPGRAVPLVNDSAGHERDGEAAASMPIVVTSTTIPRDQLAQHRRIAYRCVLFDSKVRTIKKARSGMAIA